MCPSPWLSPEHHPPTSPSPHLGPEHCPLCPHNPNSSRALPVHLAGAVGSAGSVGKAARLAGQCGQGNCWEMIHTSPEQMYGCLCRRQYLEPGDGSSYDTSEPQAPSPFTPVSSSLPQNSHRVGGHGGPTHGEGTGLAAPTPTWWEPRAWLHREHLPPGVRRACPSAPWPPATSSAPPGREKQDPSLCQGEERDEKGRKCWMWDKIVAIAGTREARCCCRWATCVPTCLPALGKTISARAAREACQALQGWERCQHPAWLHTYSTPATRHAPNAPRSRWGSSCPQCHHHPAPPFTPTLDQQGNTVPSKGVLVGKGETGASPTMLWRHRSLCHHAGSTQSSAEGGHPDSTRHCRGPQCRHQHQPPEEGRLGAHLHRLWL